MYEASSYHITYGYGTQIALFCFRACGGHKILIKSTKI